MTFSKSCPGSRAIREPTPEYIDCPSCGEEVEVWTHEMSYPCSNCGTRVFREQSSSCIDWCPYAEECIGPEVYRSLKPQTGNGSPGAEAASPLDVLTQEHDEALKHIGLLRAATLCLRVGASASAPLSGQALDQSVSHLGQVLEFFDKELRLHFRREEEVLFPILEKHMGREGSPTQLLLAEHAELWRWHDQLKAKVAELQRDGGAHLPVAATAIYEVGSHITRLLKGHIKKENESLLPLAKSLLGKDELDEVSGKWRSLAAEVS